MIQEIITGLILVTAVAIVIYKIIQSVRKPEKSCGGCADSCSGCAVMDLKSEIASKKKQTFDY